jgi:DnaK suppressor protein
MAQKATKKTPAASKKAVAKKTVKAAAKPASKSRSVPARPAPARAKPAPVKTAVKAIPAKPKPAAGSAKSAPAKTKAVAAKPAGAAGKKAPPAPHATVPAQRAAAPAALLAPTAAAAPARAAAGVATTAPPPRRSGRGASKYAVAQVPMPLPPPTSRFADRFAPPRPPTRQMNNLELDVPRHAQKSDPKLANAWKTKAGRDLTEAEILAMPESEYMNEKQLEFFRVKLQALKDDLLSNAGETTEHLREDTSIVPDPADRATIEEEHALELRTRDRERKLLKKISQSLTRIDSGEYGFCDETGEPIGLGRLIARPTATLSLEAQQRRELKQKMFGD